MTQSGYIAGALLLGFVLYLAAKNRLGVYASVFWGAAPGEGSLASTGASAAKQGISSALFGPSGPTTEMQNPISGLTSVIMAIPEIFAP